MLLAKEAVLVAPVMVWRVVENKDADHVGSKLSAEGWHHPAVEPHHKRVAVKVVVVVPTSALRPVYHFSSGVRARVEFIGSRSDAIHL